jgi:dihydrofolate reductase
MPGMNAIVFSQSLSQDAVLDATVSNDVEGTVNALKSSPGKDIWLFGGGELFRSVLELGLVDSMEIAVIPVLLGGGIPLLPQLSSQVPLKLIDQRIYPKSGIVMLYYVPAR